MAAVLCPWPAGMRRALGVAASASCGRQAVVRQIDDATPPDAHVWTPGARASRPPFSRNSSAPALVVLQAGEPQDRRSFTSAAPVEVQWVGTAEELLAAVAALWLCPTQSPSPGPL